MSKQTYGVLLVGVMILVLAACGQFENTSAPANTPELAVPENPTNQPDTMVDPNSAENSPTALPAHGVDPEQFRRYIGSTYPPLPEGLSEGFSMLIQDEEDHALILVIDGADKMLWLNRMTHYDPDGTAYWEVKDVLDLSNLEADLILIPDGCFLHGVPDSEIIVAGKNGTTHLAWRANTTLDRFEVIPINGIECRSDKAMPL